MTHRPFPPAARHGALQELFPDIFFVLGSIEMTFGITVSFSRNMTVLRQGSSLTLVNSMRLDDAGLAALDALGKVEHVIRLAGYHGRDDAFYADRYQATVWCLRDQIYAAGFNDKATPADAYFHANVQMDDDTELPIPGARLFRFTSVRVPEALLLLDRDGGIVISGDSLQNWAEADEYFSLGGKLMMRLMGFLKPYNVGPGWLRAAKPDPGDLRRVLDLEFEHLLPVHGKPVIGEARERFRPAIERVG